MADIKAIAAELVALTVQEVIDLKNELKETYGIEPAAAAVVVAAGGEGGAAAEEKTSFDVILKSPGAAKLQVVKALMSRLASGLTGWITALSIRLRSLVLLLSTLLLFLPYLLRLKLSLRKSLNRLHRLPLRQETGIGDINPLSVIQ